MLTLNEERTSLRVELEKSIEYDLISDDGVAIQVQHFEVQLNLA